MKLYTRNELNDGRVFFDKQPPRYMTVFIIFLILLLVTLVISANFIKRPYVVKGQGIISVDGTGYISSKTNGIITDIQAMSGQYVEAGDVILNISSGSEGLQKLIVEAQIVDLEETLEIMEKYEESLEQKENNLSKVGKELEYYGKLSYYLDILNQEAHESDKTDKEITEKQSELERLKKDIKQLETKITDTKEQITKYEENNKDINVNENEVRYQSLLNEIAELEEKIAHRQENDAIIQKLTMKQKELDKLEKEIGEKQTENKNNINLDKLIENKAEFESDLEMKKSKIEGLEEELKQLNEQSEAPYSQAEQTKLQLISELGEKRNQIHNQLTELRANKGVATEQDTVHVVTATKSGIIHFLQPLSLGMSIQQNQVIGEIATETEDFYVDAYIHAQDRSRITVGQSVNVAVIGINNYRFGTISGTIEFIEPGTIQNESTEGVISLYRTKISVSKQFLSNKSGETIELIRSMPVEARVVYDKESYLEWLLNLLNLKSG